MLNSLQEKLGIKCIEHFALVLQNTKASSHSKLSVLQERELLSQVSSGEFSRSEIIFNRFWHSSIHMTQTELAKSLMIAVNLQSRLHDFTFTSIAWFTHNLTVVPEVL